ncbi:MAG: ATP-dependent DNA helicase RecG, partial [Patescibacteria group bacterium]
MQLDDPVSNAYYIGTKYSELLRKLDIFTLKDLLYYYPIKYEDSRDIKMIENIVPKDINIVKGKIKTIKSIYTRNRKNMTTAEIEDDSGTADIIWFNQKYIINNIKIGDEIIIVGKTDIKKDRFIFIAPQFEVLKNTETVHFGRITPIYSQTKGISSKWLRSRIKTLLSNFDIEDDYLPLDIREKYNLITIKDALFKLHFPNNFDDIKKAKRRLGFEEVLYIQIISYMRKQERERRSAYKISIDEEKIQEFVSSLDFTLTNAQRRSINEIYMDIKRGIPMNRLLEGDVGTGKTIVAVIATYTMYLNNLQTAIMVPTSILAKQHYSSFKNYLAHKGVKVEIVTSKSKKIDKSASVFIGTQALLQDKDIFKKLGLIIIDEQHRFGVRQRENLISKGIDPHILTMTATPIPRTLALGIYGDLDISILDEKPEGRIDVKTYLVNDQKRYDAYNFIRGKVKNGEQAFILCPLITESEKLQLKNVEEEY